MTIEEAKKELEKFVRLKTTMRPLFVDIILQALEAEPPKNVFVFRSGVLYKHDDIEVICNIIKRQVEEGVVILPPHLTLEAVTGPCTDVEVIIKQEERP